MSTTLAGERLSRSCGIWYTAIGVCWIPKRDSWARHRLITIWDWSGAGKMTGGLGSIGSRYQEQCSRSRRRLSWPRSTTGRMKRSERQLRACRIRKNGMKGKMRRTIQEICLLALVVFIVALRILYFVQNEVG